MGVQLIRAGLLVAILLATGSASIAAAPAEPAVKKSKNNICHQRGTADYEQTKRFTSFASIEACLKRGCRLPKKVARKSPHFDLSKPTHPGDVGVQYGPPVRVIDGDTLIVMVQGAEVRFRLSGVDAPEHDQPFGREARKELESIVGTQECVMQVVETDSHGRTVAHLWIGGMYVNAELMRRGMAWFDSVYAQDEALHALEEEARDEKRGLWSLPLEERKPPWDWREEKR